MISSINSEFPGQLDFRIAESPVLISKDFKNKLFESSEAIIDTLVSSDFVENTKRAVPAHQNVPNENAHTSFLAIDYAITKDRNGDIVPKLIELQGFPSIFGYQPYLSAKYAEFFDVDSNFSCFPVYESEEVYNNELRSLILGSYQPENVILLEIFPEKQKTRIDFAVIEKLLGIEAVCLTKVIKEGRKIFYIKNGKKTPIYRIYNRLIFDELDSYPDLKTDFKLTDDIDVEWVGHPNWFFRISKFAMPFLKDQYIPDTRFLSEYEGLYPADLDNYVLKPLFSFAGSGVQLHVNREILDKINDQENYILQRKVSYEPIIESPEGGVKCEVRLMYGWRDDAERPQLMVSLSRLSRGEMIGVRYNKDFTWVGSSAVFFEK